MIGRPALLRGACATLPAPRFIAFSADGKSCADAYGKPECTPTAANTSGYSVPTIIGHRAAGRQAGHVDLALD